uniref:Uncharacterized protein n=2 Tax=environmental samples TaxID=68359 RepID=A0A075HDF0_9EURY|nr:hypothetical protein [uncultured marine group II/III euryarchaeote KM3_60_H01]AIF19076.1 hypothetical protein [uncultured marine group II/III euryarchaeote KM3_85_D04]MBC8517471.1 hypothetical protein [Euryarchaeota archaeon]
MEEESYSDALSKILQSARGPLTDIEDFDLPKITVTSDSIDETAESQTEENGADRTNLRRLAAVMAVLSMQADRSESKSDIGRQLGSAWAQDHRLSAMGLPGLAYSRAKRSTWR